LLVTDLLIPQPPAPCPPACLPAFLLSVVQEMSQLLFLSVMGLLGAAAVSLPSPPRIACIWVLPGAANWPYSFDLTVYTLMAHDMRWGLDLHVLTPDPPAAYLRGGEKARWPFMRDVYFHTVTNSDWHQRIRDRLGQNVSYPLTNTKKIADFKPMFAHMFPDIIVIGKYDYWVYGDYDGFFGSYDAILNYDVLPLYEVVSGFTAKYHAEDIVDFSRMQHYVLGSWTMFRNSLKVNTLFRRSVNVVTVITDSHKQYSFDENTDSPAEGKESFHDVIQTKAIDVTRCCYNDLAQPSVRLKKEYKIVIDLRGDYIRDDVKVKLRWEKNKPVTLWVDGFIGGKRLYRKGTAQGLFLHFLQWKFIRPRLFHTSMQSFISTILAREGGYTSVDCFELNLNTKNYETTELLYEYNFCSTSP
jgi:hypothetical protein